MVFKISEVQLNQDSSDGFQELDPLSFIDVEAGVQRVNVQFAHKKNQAYCYAIFLCYPENLVG